MSAAGEAAADPYSFKRRPPPRDGGALSVDFVNTLSWRGRKDFPEGPAPEERLPSYEELLHWCRHTESLEAAMVAKLEREARRRPEAARAVLAEAIALREALHDLFLSPEAPPRAALTRLNALLARAPERRALVAGKDGLAWREGPPGEPLEAPLWPLVRDAGELLASGSARRIRTCAEGSCAWLFLDESRNRSRRWCSMEICGNRAKARRHYARRKRDEA